MTEAEQKAWEAEMKATGIKIVTNAPPGTAVITLLAKRPTAPTDDAS